MNSNKEALHGYKRLAQAVCLQAITDACVMQGSVVTGKKTTSPKTKRINPDYIYDAKKWIKERHGDFNLLIDAFDGEIQQKDAIEMIERYRDMTMIEKLIIKTRMDKTRKYLKLTRQV